MTRDEIVALFGRRRDAWRRRDAPELAGNHTDDGIVESPASGEVKGRSAIEMVYRSWFAAFPDLEFREEQLLVDGDHAALFWTVTGTHEGTFCGLSATGRRFTIRGVSLYQVRDGAIIRERRLYDFTALLLQIGVLKAKPE
jgi:steroid delta-isomerase-like uncharacterized protein